MRRSAVSIPSNIAEGQGRTSVGEFRQFLGMARGSNCEFQTQLEIARALNFGKPGLIDEAESLSNEVRKMLFGLMNSIKAPEEQEAGLCELRTTNYELYWTNP